MNFTNFDVFLMSQFEHFFKEMNKVALTINIFEILVLAFALYYLYRRFIKGTHSENLVRGSLILVVMWGLSELLIRINLNIFGVFLKTLVSVVSFGLIVIFQPELRRFLGYIGQGNLFEKLFLNGSEQIGAKQLDTAKELIETIKYLSKSKTGGLIVLQKDVTSLAQSDVGVKINADVSQELLLTIFFPKTPLHDGAVVIRDNKIVSAGVLLPLTEDKQLDFNKLMEIDTLLNLDAEIVQKVFDLRPAAIIRRLELKRPVYQKVAAYGHFGRDIFPWEKVDKIDAIIDEARKYCECECCCTSEEYDDCDCGEDCDCGDDCHCHEEECSCEAEKSPAKKAKAPAKKAAAKKSSSKKKK